MATVNYGRHSSLPHPDFGYLAPGQMRGVTFDKTGKHLWAYKLGMVAGKHTAGPDGLPNDVTARIAVYAVDGSMNPTSRLGYCSSMTINTVMNTWDGGKASESSIIASTGPDNSAIPLSASTRYHIAVLGTVGSLGHGMAAAAIISADNKNFYDRSGLSQPPPNPFGAYVAWFNGHLAIWAVCDENVAPAKPTGLSPAGTVNDLVPTFTAPFVDDNQNRGDELSQFRIQVRSKGSGSTIWNTTLTATSGERAADAFSRAYSGSTLTRGVAYEWRTQMADYFGTWSPWSNWVEFTPAALGAITLDSAPTGKIADQTPDFEGRWTHQTSATMTKAQVRVWNGAGTTILAVGAEAVMASPVSSSAAPGTLFTLGNGDSGLAPLSWGNDYQYDMRGYDGTQWSDWSNKRSFRVNGAPTVPTAITPGPAGIVVGARPLLTCKSSDSDDTTGTGLVVYARIKDDGGTVLQTRAMTLTGDIWTYQTTSGDVPSYDDYRWDAYAFDGDLYSGEKLTSGDAIKSTEGKFTYAAVPTVAITDPSDPTTTSTPLIEWTASGQSKYRLKGYDANGTMQYDSGEQTDSTQQHQVDAVNFSVPWRNGDTLDFIVSVYDGGLWGDSAAYPLTLQYTPPAQLANVQITPVKIGTDLWESAMRITWDQTSYGADWMRYTIVKHVDDEPDIVVFDSTSPGATTFTYYYPCSGVDHTFSITQTVLFGIDEITSDPVEVTERINLGGVVICAVTDPDNLRTTMRYTNERDYSRTIAEMVFVPLSGDDPTSVRGKTYIDDAKFDLQLFDDAMATANERRLEYKRIDKSHATVCYRDNHGRKMFAMIADAPITDQLTNWFTASIHLRAERYSEAV